jgi:truncated hemoglobin YjbI
MTDDRAHRAPARDEDHRAAADEQAEWERRVAEAVATADLRPLARAFIAAALDLRAQQLDNQRRSSPRRPQTGREGGG